MMDNDIIKALECCGNIVDSTCKKCVYHETYNASCVVRLMRDALDLINRKDAEIEKLNVELVGMRGACESYKMHYDNAQTEIERLNGRVEATEISKQKLLYCFKTAKSEAIKEFAERLKEKRCGGTHPYVLVDVIDNVVKELTEVQE